MEFYFNISMDSTYVKNYSTLMCFHVKATRFWIKFNEEKQHPKSKYSVDHV